MATSLRPSPYHGPTPPAAPESELTTPCSGSASDPLQETAHGTPCPRRLTKSASASGPGVDDVFLVRSRQWCRRCDTNAGRSWMCTACPPVHRRRHRPGRVILRRANYRCGHGRSTLAHLALAELDAGHIPVLTAAPRAREATHLRDQRPARGEIARAPRVRSQAAAQIRMPSTYFPRSRLSTATLESAAWASF